MMTTNIDYYVAKGRSAAAIQEWIDLRNRYNQELLVVLDEFGIQRGKILSVYMICERFLGIEHKEPLPDCLRRDRKDPSCCRPNSRTKVGRQLKKRLDALDGPSEGRFHKALCGQPFSRMSPVNGRMMMSGYGFEMFGEQVVVYCPEGGFQPFDSEPLARSEYWKMKEEAA